MSRPSLASASVVTKTLADQRRSLTAWVAGVVVLILMYAALWPTIRDNTGYNQLIEQMPESLRAMFSGGTGGDMSTPQGYVYVELLSFMAPMIVLAYAITAGAAAVAGEEDRHTIDLLLVNPVSRARVVVEKFAAMLIGTTLIVGAMWVALMGLGAAFDMDLSPADTAAAMVHLGLLGVELGTLALLIGAATAGSGWPGRCRRSSRCWPTSCRGWPRWSACSTRSRWSRRSTSTSLTTRSATVSRSGRWRSRW